MQFTQIMKIILVVVFPIFAQSFPMDRWLDKVETAISSQMDALSYPLLLGQNKNRAVDISILKYDIKSKTLILSVRIYDIGKKGKRYCIPVDDYPINTIKDVNLALIITLSKKTDVFVNGNPSIPSVNDLKNIFTTISHLHDII